MARVEINLQHVRNALAPLVHCTYPVSAMPLRRKCNALTSQVQRTYPISAFT